jgi:hypothetical protein
MKMNARWPSQKSKEESLTEKASVQRRRSSKILKFEVILFIYLGALTRYLEDPNSYYLGLQWNSAANMHAL